MSVRLVHDFDRLPDGTAYLVMELLKGVSLAERLEKCPRGLPSEEVAWLGWQIADTLAAVHAHDIVHRDLKPSNSMLFRDPLDDSERTTVLDFGIAKLGDELLLPRQRATTTNVMIGTLLYIAPEQCRSSRRVDGKADVYSLGIMLYEMLSGEPPFMGDSDVALITMHLHDAPRPLAELVPLVAVKLTSLVHSMLSKDREARPSMAEVAAALRTLGRSPRSASALTAEPELSRSKLGKECKSLNQEALERFKAQRYKEALTKFQSAYAMVPAPVLLLSTGRTLFRLKDYSRSVEHLTRYRGTEAVSNPESKTKVERYLAEALESLRKFNQQRDSGLRAIAERRYDDALNELDAAFALQPDPELLVEQGKALHALFRYEEAIRKYLQYLDLASPELRERRLEVAGLLKDAEAAAAAAAQPETPPTALACEKNPACAGAPTPPVEVTQPRPASGTIDHDLDLLNQPGRDKPSSAKSTWLWVGLSIGGAALTAGIIGGVVGATQHSQSSGSSAPLYAVTWR